MFEQRPEGLKILAARSLALPFHAAVEGHGLAAGPGKHGPATLVATANGFNQRLVEPAVRVLDEGPGAHVGRAHAFGGGAETSSLADEFEQIHAARSQGDFASPHNTQARDEADSGFRWLLGLHAHNRKLIWEDMQQNSRGAGGKKQGCTAAKKLVGLRCEEARVDLGAVGSRVLLRPGRPHSEPQIFPPPFRSQ